jgi:hypothetical protein
MSNNPSDYSVLAALYPASTSNQEVGRLTCLAGLRGYQIFDVYAEHGVWTSPRPLLNQLLIDATNHCFAAVFFSIPVSVLQSDADFNRAIQHLLDTGVRCFAVDGVIWEARQQTDSWVWRISPPNRRT